MLTDRQHSSRKEMAFALEQELRKHFKPEFINRLDEIIVFKSVTQEALYEIVRIHLSELLQRARAQGIEIDVFGQEVYTWLAQRGYDPHFGVRPLKRLLQRSVASLVSKVILQGSATDTRRNYTLLIDEKGELCLVQASQDLKR